MKPSSHMKFKLPGKERLSPNYALKLSELVIEFAQEIAPPDSPPAFSPTPSGWRFCSGTCR